LYPIRSSTSRSVPEQDDGRVDEKPVRERVGDLAEGRLDAPAACEKAVDLVGDGRGAEEDGRRPAPAAVARQDERGEDRDDQQARNGERVRQLLLEPSGRGGR
jgi:hypothetical protein